MKRRIAVIDAETDPFKQGRIPRPFLWGFYDGETYEEFETAEALVAFLEDQSLIVYAHNGGKFDFHYLVEFIETGSDIMVINGRIARFRIGACEFRDSFNILPVALGAYQKDEIDYAIFERGEREKPENACAISQYLYGDCLYLYDFVMKFVNRYGLHITQASAAMKQWRAISGRKPPEDDGGLLYQQLSPYYYGGRCQAFEYGVFDEHLESADINSAYPYAMLHRHPISTTPHWGHEDEWRQLPIEQQCASFLRVRGISRGAFPFRGSDGSLYFPSDDHVREYCVTGWELMAALETESVDSPKILEACWFTELIDFADYINSFYEEKARAKAVGDTAGYWFAKLFMNSLYGKFGANPDEYKNYKVADYWMLDDDGTAGEWSFAGEFGVGCLIAKPQSEDAQRWYNIATAASITGFVRAMLWRAICQCRGVVYCDTDSIIARDVRSLPFGARLGEWELEGVYDRGGVAGRKLYAMRRADGGRADDGRAWKVASKGVRLDPEQIMVIATGETVRFVPEVPTFSIHRGPHFIERDVRRTEKFLRE